MSSNRKPLHSGTSSVYSDCSLAFSLETARNSRFRWGSLRVLDSQGLKVPAQGEPKNHAAETDAMPPFTQAEQSRQKALSVGFLGKGSFGLGRRRGGPRSLGTALQVPETSARRRPRRCVGRHGSDFQNPAADRVRSGSARCWRMGSRERRPSRRRGRAHAPSRAGRGWSRNSEAGARTGPGRGGWVGGRCAGAGAAEAAAPGGGFVYPEKEV